MNLNRISDKFIHPIYHADTLQLKRARLLVRSSLLTSLFSTSYLALSVFIGFKIGVYCMIFNVIGYLILPFLFRRKVSLLLVSNVFVLMGAGAITLIVHYSGGLWSPIMVWLAAVPVMAAFLAGRASAILWGVIMYSVTIYYGIMELMGNEFIIGYDTNYKSLFMVTSTSGFLLIIFMIAMVFEFSARQALEALAVRNREIEELNKEKDYIIQIMAHDLRNPLYVIKSWLAILRQGKNESISTEEIYRMMEESVDRSAELIDKVTKMDASEQSSLQVKLDEADLEQLTQKVINNYKEASSAKEIQLHWEYGREDFKALVDPVYYSQIMDNFISNAVKYTAKGKEIFIKMLKVDNLIRIEVIDQGPGLSSDQQSKLFKKFSRLNVAPTGGESSTGLGLYLVKKYAKMMNGDVWCESEVGKGSTFIFTIPDITN